MIDVISVLGAGTMGHGIAQVAAMAGYQVYLFDIKEELVTRGFNSIKNNLDKGVEKGKVTSEARDKALANIKTTTILSDAASPSNLVIEAVPELLELKRSIFARLDEFCSPSTILATNTSSLSIKDIASSTKRPQQVLGMHFFNPVHIMKLLEVVYTEETSQVTINTTLEISRHLGKEPILVKDSPGFASSRLGITLGLEAMRMLQQGVASAADIDKAMELGYNHPMGPLKLTDLVGLDVRLNIADYLFSTLGSEVFRAPEILRQKVAEGKLGKKSGEGFYKW
ncbi:MAG: 3-hydroxyacyl-CoA dehydrogenase family protein [Acidobacteria bacterium]|nr:3-hydroxyacyl-CoA dehydrogenase family protein [Acidobacteriota bacterium]